MTISKDGRAFKQMVQQNYAHLKPVSHSVILEVIIHPKQRKKNGADFKRIIDLDNSLKCILDSLIGLAYIDDKQVKGIYVEYGNSIIQGGASVVVKEFTPRAFVLEGDLFNATPS